MQTVLKELRPTLALALPMIVAQVSQMLIGITDAAFIGRVGTVELAAAALYHAMRELTAAGDARGGAALRRELLERFGQTYFAARVRSAPANKTDTEETP